MGNNYLFYKLNSLLKCLYVNEWKGPFAPKIIGALLLYIDFIWSQRNSNKILPPSNMNKNIFLKHISYRSQQIFLF